MPATRNKQDKTEDFLNLQSARQSIESELDYARSGLAYYVSRSQALEELLSYLDSLDEQSALRGNGSSATVRRKTSVSVPKRETKSKGKQAGRVPSTGQGFWLELVSAEKKSAADIANAAADKLGFDPTKDRQQILVLKQRVTPSLNSLVSAGKIKDDGAGRQRRFFRP
jgi:hypothetical protein